MATIVPFPQPEDDGHSHKHEIQTAGQEWTGREKKLLDRAEFLQAMIIVLDDVRLKNARERDYGMMEVVAEEIPAYQERLSEIQVELGELRRRYQESQRHAN